MAPTPTPEGPQAAPRQAVREPVMLNAADLVPAVEARKRVEVAVAIIFDAGTGHLLICQRKADTVLAGYWEFPGGKCLPGETPAACACREALEETGLTIRPRRALPVIEHTYPHAHVRLHPFVCERAAGSLQLLAVADARWIRPGEVVNYRFPEANGGLVRQIASGEAGLADGDR
jgi:mutator protein MutT